jgi:hypothetical protein
MFGRDWDNAEATIVARDADFTGDGTVADYTFVADVRLPSGETFRATVREPTIATDFWAPSIGDVVSVLVRPKDRKVKFDKDDPRLSVKAYDVGKNKAFAEAQQQPAGTPVAAWTPDDLPAALAQKLGQLGINGGGQPQVFGADSAQAQAILAALTQRGTPGIPSGTQPGIQPDASAAPTPEARLLQLKSLHERGLLTVEEYTEQRQRILDEL